MKIYLVFVRVESLMSVTNFEVADTDGVEVQIELQINIFRNKWTPKK